MPKATTQAGSDGSYIYLFVNTHKLVQIGNGSLKTHEKLTKKTETSDLPADVLNVFDQLDKQAANNYVANSLTSQSGHRYIASLTDQVDKLTKMAISQRTQIKEVSLSDGQIALSNVN